MSFLLWQSAALDGSDASSVHVASSRRVFAAAEVPLLREANDVLRQIHSRAQAQAQQLEAAREAARRQGHDEGRARGLHAAQDEVAQRLASLDRDARAHADEVRGQIAVLALAAVQKMLGDLPFAQSLVAASAQAARDVLPDQRVTLHVHPSRVAEVRAHLEASHAAASLTTAPLTTASRDIASQDAGRTMPALPAHTEVVPDPLLGIHDGRLETPHGSIQIGLDTQLARLAQAWGVRGATRPDRSNPHDA